MQKYYLIVLLNFCWGPSMAQHPQEEDFLAVINYIKGRNLQATFVYDIRSSQGKLEKELEGGIAIQGNQYRLTLGTQEVINNGETVWTYLTDVNEVQIHNCDPKQTAANPWMLLADYRQDYKLLNVYRKIIGDQTYDVIDLLSKNAEHSLPKI